MAGTEIRRRLRGDVAHLQPGGIDVLPDVGGDPPAHRVGVGPRRAQATVEARRIVGIEGEKVQDALGVQLAMALQIGIQGAGDQQRHGQLFQAIAATALRHQRQRMADIQHPRHVFRALQIARHPVQIGSSTTQHDGSRSDFA
ncbi:hypothetical protein D3C75_1048870 [compost metagenome]